MSHSIMTFVFISKTCEVRMSCCGIYYTYNCTVMYVYYVTFTSLLPSCEMATLFIYCGSCISFLAMEPG